MKNYKARITKYIVALFCYTPIKADSSRDIFSIEEVGRFPCYGDASIFAEVSNKSHDMKILNNSQSYLYQYNVITTKEAAAYKKEAQS